MSEDLQQNMLNQEPPEPKINVRELIDRYLHYWLWFVIGVGLSIFIAYTMLRYSTNIYQSSATILIQNAKENDVLSGLNANTGISLFPERMAIGNEIALFKTPTILRSVAAQLELHKTYKMVGQNAGIKKSEMWNNSPVVIRAVGPDSLLYNVSAQFELTVLSSGRYELTMNETEYLGKHNFNTPIATTIGTISFDKTPNFGSGTVGNTFLIGLSPLEGAATGLNGSIVIDRADKTSDLIAISMQGPVIEKNNAIIRALIDAHRQEKIDDQNEVARNTTDFINDRMAYLSKELGEVEKDAESFKQEHQLVDVMTDGQSYLSKRDATEAKIIETNVQLKLSEYLQDYLAKHNTNTTLLPSNLGFEDGTIVAITTQYNKLILDRERLLKNSKPNNPQVLRMEEQLQGLRTTMEDGLKANKSRLKIILASLNDQERRYQGKIANVPAFERQFRDIERQQKIKETLYIFLLQKREENEISTAASIGNTKIILEPASNGVPISPNRSKYYIFAVALGLLIPFGLIYLKYLLDSKLHGIHDLIKFKLPAIGEIPKGDDDQRSVVATKNARTHIAEAFRMVRSNMNFLLEDKKEKDCKTIMFTSSIAGEGKTFISINIGHTLSHSDKKVVVIGLDLRAPKIGRYLDITSQAGVSNYIVNESLTFDDLLIQDPGNPNMQYILSGDIPPNPSELLLRERLAELIEEAQRRFDYVIIDTAPVALVADSLHLSKFADLTIYVARAEHLDRRLLSIPAGLYHDKKIPNMAVLVNATDLMGKG